MTPPCIIIGASHAGAQLALSLRQQGWQDEILVISNEDALPYQRPPLSKTFLSGEKNTDQILIRPMAAFEKAQVDFLFNTQVININRQDNALELDNGQSLAYSKLALCTGSSAIKIPLPGHDKKGVHYLRTQQDAINIRQHAAADKHAVIIGGGFIGLESAAILCKMGMKVSVLEAQDRLLKRVVCENISNFYEKTHQQAGVSIHTNTQAASINGEERVNSVIDKIGKEYKADLVIIGVGVHPNVQLAQDCGLDIDNGIVINGFAQTRDADIVAAGDATFFHHDFYRKNMRLESIQNAMDQAKSAAASLCGKSLGFSHIIPRFWSDQYDFKLQIIGISDGFDKIEIRGNINEGKSFSVFYLKENKLICAAMVNAPRVLMKAQACITQQSVLSSQALDELFEQSPVL